MPVPRLLCVVLAVPLLAAGGLLPPAGEVAAQQRAALPGAAMVWPETTVPGVVVGGVDRVPTVGLTLVARPAQERPLPVYDDAGNLIRMSEIRAEVDPSGARGAFWGILIGAVLGSGIGTALAPTGCGERRGNLQYYCSPREEALNAALPGGLALFFGAAGGWIGWETDRVTFDEAVERIRRQRREGPR